MMAFQKQTARCERAVISSSPGGKPAAFFAARCPTDLRSVPGALLKCSGAGRPPTWGGWHAGILARLPIRGALVAGGAR